MDDELLSGEVDSTGHGEHVLLIVAPRSEEYFPISQPMHSADDLRSEYGEYVPAGHLLHDAAPAPEYLPGPQVSHEVPPASSEYFPAPQLWQVCADVAA